MTVGVLRARLILREARSLKDKRQVVQGVKDRLRARFNVAVAETDFHEVRQRAEVSVAAVSNERRSVQRTLEQALRHVRGAPGAELAGHEIEYF